MTVERLAILCATIVSLAFLTSLGYCSQQNEQSYRQCIQKHTPLECSSQRGAGR